MTQPTILKIKTECVSFSNIFLENWKPGAYDTNEFVVTGQAIYRFGWRAAERNHARIQRAVNTLNVIYGNAALDAEIEGIYAAGGYRRKIYLESTIDKSQAVCYTGEVQQA